MDWEKVLDKKDDEAAERKQQSDAANLRSCANFPARRNLALDAADMTTLIRTWFIGNWGLFSVRTLREGGEDLFLSLPHH